MSVLKMNHRMFRRAATAAGLIVAVIVTLSGCLEDPDFDGPIIGTSISDDVLYVEVVDVQSEVSQVKVDAGSAFSSTYLRGFRTITVDLESLGTGSHTIRISAEDTAGNRSVESLDYERVDYYEETRVLQRTYEPVFSSWGPQVAELEAIHKRTTYTPARTDVPPRPAEDEHSYLVHNKTGSWLYSVTATVTAYDAAGYAIWTHTVTQGSLAPLDYIRSGTVHSGADTPAYYTIVMEWY